MSSKRANSQKQAFADHVGERMSLFGPVDIRPMFGGFGIYRQGLMFALIAEERLYFKVDDASQPHFDAKGLPPFVYESNGHVARLRYHEAPPEVFDEPQEMAAWARLGYECAVRQAARKAAAKGGKKDAGKKMRADARESLGGHGAAGASEVDESVFRLKKKGDHQGGQAEATKASVALTDLQNLGPKSVEMLTRAGIRTAAQLRKLGAVRAYARTKAVWPAASLNLLWALEGALTDRDWRIVAETDRASLLMALEDVGAVK